MDFDSIVSISDYRSRGLEEPVTAVNLSTTEALLVHRK
jgi:hypothetical protein